MNFNFYIFGTPNGYNQYPADSNSGVFQEFTKTIVSESQLTVNRGENLVYYVYIRRLQESANSFIGFCLVFNGVYCQNLRKLFGLFDRAYVDTQLKGEFFKLDRGIHKYSVSKFIEKSLEIERIKAFFKTNLDFEFSRDFIPLPPSFQHGNGDKRISIKENDGDILTAFAAHEILHIFNNEKSLSELEYAQKMLTSLYQEKHVLQQKFNVILAKKKQYGIIIALCLVCIVFGVGLFIFNVNLQSRDSRIINLNEQVTKKSIDISNLNATVSQLQTEKQKLVNEKRILQDNIFKLTTSNNELTIKVDQLESEIDRRLLGK